MTHYFACVCLFFFICTSAYPQAAPERYRDIIFSRVNTQKNLQYRTPTNDTKRKYCQFDLYQPASDTAGNRPLIIWMHGGGFKFGSNRAKSMRMWSRDFARRGYVCAAINYRLSKKNPLRDFKALVQGCHDAMQDAEIAMEYFRMNKDTYQIDPSTIILGGNSAGGMVALHTAYSNRIELAKMTQNNKIINSISPNQSNNISGVINFWGAIFDTTWLLNAKVPIVSVHGRKDRVVPYKQNGAAIFGSYIIHQVADSLQIPNRLKTYDNYAHELQRHFLPILRGRSTKRRWLESSRFAAEFLHHQIWNSPNE